MTPQLLFAIGIVVLAAGAGTLLSFGSRYRVGRILATAPDVSIADAVQLARGGERRVVRVQGRIDSEETFEDAQHRPLVLRRTRFDTRPSAIGRWRTFDAQTEAVPFELNEGLDSIAIDRRAIGDGLVVVPRRSIGRIRDLGDRGPGPGTRIDPDAEARVTVEQVSSVEHAIVVGVPVLDPDAAPTLTAGLGRPLILTTLEIPEAMRVLTGGARGRSTLSAAGLIVGAAITIAAVAWWILGALVAPAAALADSPVPSILPGGADTRSAGQGPGLVGDPAFAILGVVAIALLAIGGTLAYVRLTGGRRDRQGG